MQVHGRAVRVLQLTPVDSQQRRVLAQVREDTQLNLRQIPLSKDMPQFRYPPATESLCKLPMLRHCQQVWVARSQTTSNHASSAERSVDSTVEGPAMHKIRQMVHKSVLELVEFSILSNAGEDGILRVLVFEGFKNFIVRRESPAGGFLDPFEPKPIKHVIGNLVPAVGIEPFTNRAIEHCLQIVDIALQLCRECREVLQVGPQANIRHALDE